MLSITNYIVLLYGYYKLDSNAVFWKLNWYLLMYWRLQFIYTVLVYFFPDLIYPLMQVPK